ncbi:acyl-CoA dehydrogenase [Niveispirillum sp. SYP-B3756]|uniref:acyl-CoA dehydrogenase family protein n=1 Tax=Niveispirillum sp. SYP-B3756 TaxID=2662178 RepID=UPI00129151EE|nr:acyl-CoA dehydrogenase family protein [Niveispirillum sp. SYP-B3756]MQP68293.1 acyl-CoA dehydrogenase [Niveispirillum sp. SYP-B3756]
MNDDNSVLTDSFRRLVADIATPERTRTFEAAPALEPVWSALAASGFLDALVPEDCGGAGLSLASVFPLVMILGEHAVSVPYAETMVARALLAANGQQAPDDAAIILAPPSPILPNGAAATHALVNDGERIALVRLVGVGEDPFRAGGATGIQIGDRLCDLPADGFDLGLAAAGLAAAQMAGAMSRLLSMSLRYANERQQFGRPLGKFQAIQQQLSVMAEQVISVQVAARTAMSGHGFNVAGVAAAKARANEATHLVNGIAHAVHGAIGATEEFDLQLYSRRLKQWQLAFGSESFWAGQLGRLRILAGSATSADFIRDHLCDGAA